MNMPGFTAEAALPQGEVYYTGDIFFGVPNTALPQARNVAGGLSNEGDCVGRYMKCVIGCYSKNTNYLQGCLDSCRASLNLCQSFLSPIRAIA